jgi:hypothetical protein
MGGFLHAGLHFVGLLHVGLLHLGGADAPAGADQG